MRLWLKNLKLKDTLDDIILTPPYFYFPYHFKHECIEIIEKDK